jgi:RNA polymerase sigma-70 factor (ECF subfamily)
MALRITGRREDAEDIAQGTVAAYGLAGDLIRNPEAWVTQVAVHASIDLLRQFKREVLTDPSEMCQDSTDPSREPNDVDRIVGRILYHQVLQLLPPKQQAVLKLRYGSDLQRAKIAEILGVTEETVKTHLERAIKRIRGTDSLTDGPKL